MLGYRRFLFSSLAFSLSVACGGGSSSDGPEEETSARHSELVSAAAGGTVITPFGVSIVIPPNALAQDTQIVIEKGDQSLPSGIDAYGEVYTFGPEGLAFQTDSTGATIRATVWLPYDAPGRTRPDVLWTAAGDPNTFVPRVGMMFLPTAANPDTSGNRAVGVDIEHFSRGVAGLDGTAALRCDVLSEIAAPTLCRADEKCIEVLSGDSYCSEVDSNAMSGGACSDSSQCPKDEYCAQGTCLLACDPAATDPCPAGYSCLVPQIPRAMDTANRTAASFGVCAM